MKNTTVNIEVAIKIIEILQRNNISPILYGSLGVSIYLKDFKEFGDIDLLVDKIYLTEMWPKIVSLMRKNGFKIVDLKEHEFSNREGLRVAFADNQVLLRDHVISPSDELATMNIGKVSILTLTPVQFLNAYSFSVKDGYRMNTRGKKDQEVIDLLVSYMENSSD